MCWWPCCGGYITTRHYDGERQAWHKDHGADVHAVAHRDGTIITGGELAQFEHVHKLRISLLGDPDAGTFDLNWAGLLIGEALSIGLTAAELEALLDASEIQYLAVEGGPLDEAPITITLPPAIKIPPVVTFPEASFTGGDEPLISMPPVGNSCRRYSAAGVLAETWHEEIVTDIEIGTETDEKIYLADGGVHVYDGDLETLMDQENPWGGEDRRISLQTDETNGFATSGHFDYGGKVQILQANGTMHRISFDLGSSGRAATNVQFTPDGNIVVFWYDLNVLSSSPKTMGLTKYAAVTGEVIWEYAEGNVDSPYVQRSWCDSSGNCYFQYANLVDGHNLVKLDPDGILVYDVAAPFPGAALEPSALCGADEDYGIFVSWLNGNTTSFPHTAHDDHVRCIDLATGAEIPDPGGVDPVRWLDPRYLRLGGGRIVTRHPDSASGGGGISDTFRAGVFADYELYSSGPNIYARGLYDTTATVPFVGSRSNGWATDASGNIYDYRFFFPTPHPDTGDPVCLWLDSGLGVHYFTSDSPRWLQGIRPGAIFVNGDGNICAAAGTGLEIKSPAGAHLEIREYAGTSGVLNLWQVVSSGNARYHANTVASDGRYSTIFTGNSAGNCGPRVTEFTETGDLKYGLIVRGNPEKIDHDPDQNIYCVSDSPVAPAWRQWNIESWDSEGTPRWRRWHGAPLRACKVIGESLYVGGDLSFPIYQDGASTGLPSLRVTEASELPEGDFDLNFQSLSGDPYSFDLTELPVDISAGDLETAINNLMVANGLDIEVTVTGGPLSSGVDFDFEWDALLPPAITLDASRMTPRWTIRRYELDGTYVRSFGRIPVNSIDAISEELIVAAGEEGISDLSAEMTQQGDGSHNCIQTIRRHEIPIAETWRIVYGSRKPLVDYGATASELQAILESITKIGAGNVTVTGGPLHVAPFVIEFVNDLGLMAIGPISVITSSTGTTRRYTGDGELEAVWNHTDDVESVWVDRDDPEKFSTGGKRVEV